MYALGFNNFSRRFCSGLVVLGLALAASPLGAEQVAAPQGSASNLPAITVSRVVAHEVTDRVQASGLIGPVERVMVAPQIEGQAIEEILVEVGDTVAAGQVMARLSDAALGLQKSQLVATRASAEAAIAQADAQLIEAQATADEAVRVRDRTSALAGQGSATRSAADQAAASAAAAVARVTVAMQSQLAAVAQLHVVDAQIADLELKLQRTAVRAPVAGVVVVRGAVVGAIASGAGQPMFEIIRDGALELRADVAEEDILRLKVGQGARITVVGQGALVDGRIHLVEPTVDQVSRLGRVRISLGQPELVRAGMFAEAEIIVESKTALTVPVSSVGGNMRDGASALRVVGGVVSLVPIFTGIRDGGLIEVVEGLAAGDTIVTKAGAFVRDGDRINPVADTLAGQGGQP